jgi:hypothetical protein
MRASGADPDAMPGELARFCRDRYAGVAGAMCLLVRSRPLAEEIAQETFVRVCEHWPEVSVMAAPATWVHRVGVMAVQPVADHSDGGRRRDVHDRPVLGPAGSLATGTAPPDRSSRWWPPDHQRAVATWALHAVLHRVGISSVVHLFSERDARFKTVRVHLAGRRSRRRARRPLCGGASIR